MDFSFLKDAQGRRPAASTAEQQPAASAPTAAPAARFSIPSHREVHETTLPSGSHNLFKASGTFRAPVQQQQQQQQQQQWQPQAHQQQPQQQHHHQQQHQQWQHPQQQPPVVPTAMSRHPPSQFQAPSPAFSSRSQPTTQPPAAPSFPAQSAQARVTPPPSAAYNPNAIVVGKRQQGNPLLKHMRNVRWQFGDVSADYVLGQSTCALYISLRYHLLHPEYIVHRIKEQLRAWGLVIVLCHIDVDDVSKPLAEITKAAVVNSCTLVCAWSPEECARYLETFKSYESKPASGIQERVEQDYLSRLSAALTSVRGVNRTDALTLANARGTLADILRSSPEQLSACPGIGPTKVQRLVDAFEQPFRKEIGPLRGGGGGGAPDARRPEAPAIQGSEQQAGTGQAAAPGQARPVPGHEDTEMVDAPAGTSGLARPLSGAELLDGQARGAQPGAGASAARPAGHAAVAGSEQLAAAEGAASASSSGSDADANADAAADEDDVDGDEEEEEEEEDVHEQLLLQATQMLTQAAEGCSSDEEEEQI